MVDFKTTLSDTLARNILMGKLIPEKTNLKNYFTQKYIMKLVSARNGTTRYYTTEKAIEEGLKRIQK